MTAALRRAYDDLVAGVQPAYPSGRRVALLVSTTRASLGREDVTAALGLGRQLAQRALGVRLVPQEAWYSTAYADGELLVALLPSVDIRRLPAGRPVVAWLRTRIDAWLALPDLDDYAAALTASELSRAALAQRCRGPVGLLPAGVDDTLFVRPAGGHRGNRIVVASPPAETSDRGVHAAARLLPGGAPLDWYGPDPQDPSIAGFRRGGPDLLRLPRLFGAAALVVVEQAHADLAWGAPPAAILEASACDAPVATNTGVGYGELGLGRLPVYRTSHALVELIGRARAGEFADLGRELGPVVRAEHTYARRATAFLDFVTEHELWTSPAQPGTVVNFVPNWAHTNPFQRMLYSRLPDGVRAVPSADAVSCPLLRDDGGDLTGQVLHVHWQNIVAQPAANHADATRRVQEFTRTVTDALERGMKLVWTVHNRMPHELDYYFHEVEVCRFLARHAHVVHVLSEHTVDAVRDLFDLDPAKVVVVRHGSYVGVYPELLDRGTARARLNLLPSERVVLFFGAIRPYKGLEQLIEAFGRIHEADPAARLVIVGRPGRTMSAQFLTRVAQLPFVTLDTSFVPDSDVHAYFRAADVQVAPYGAVLNSGSVLLGLGFGVPVVAPTLGALQSLEHEPFMFSYRAGDVAELERALRRAMDARHDVTVSERALALAEQYTGADMSEAFSREVLGRILAPGVVAASSGG